MTDYLSILRQYWHYDDFRPLQAEIIHSIGSGRDTLALLPTGGGKSICFQVPAMAMAFSKDQPTYSITGVPDGICLVITPLIALMKDQVLHLKERGIQAVCLYAGQTVKETVELLDNCQFGHVKFLYVSPERLESERFRKRLMFLPIAMIAVDEAHCISQWGYDFRPSYLKIAAVRELFPNAPVLALTATATPEVVDDIQEKLLFREKNVFRQSFIRSNLSYVVRTCESKPDMLLHILQSVPGSSVVYVRNRQKTREISDLLNKAGISADFFHAGLMNTDKDAKMQAWKNDQTRVMVATNAFGMGIDKADVRTVIHIDLPDTIEAYFQEAGRAGRDGKRAYAVLLYNRSDHAKVQKRIADSFPPRDFLKRIYEAVGDYYEVAIGFGEGRRFAFSLSEFCTAKKLPIIQTFSAITLLAQDGYWDFSEEQETPTRVQIRVTREQLYKESIYGKEELLLNFLLRNYTGLFTDPVIIHLDAICSHLQLSPDDLHQLLVQLAQNGIITYIPKRKTPFITYMKDRLPLEMVEINEHQYELKQERYRQKLIAMLEYAEQTHFCRQQLLVGYFGETTAQTCGCCDVCIDVHKQQ